MTTATSVAASAAVASPSIASEIIPSATPSPAPCSRPDLAARLDAFWREWHWRWNLPKDVSTEEMIAIEARDDAFFEKEGTLVNEIAEMPVQTLADVILQARACALSNAPFWIDRFAIEDMHDGERITRSLVEGICKLHDIDPIPHSDSLPIGEEPVALETEPPIDPIFVAIENHRHACLELFALEGDFDGEERRAAHGHMDDMAVKLTNVRPTTMAGIFALLTYVHDVNTGKVHFPGHPDRYTEEEFWPCELSDDAVKSPRGRVLELPFPYWVMENIRAAMMEAVIPKTS